MTEKNVQIIDCLSPDERVLLDNGSGTAGWKEHKVGSQGKASKTRLPSIAG